MINKLKLIVCTDGIFPYLVGGMQRHSRLLIEHLIQFDQYFDEIIVIHPHNDKIFHSNLIKEIQIEGINPKRNYLIECYKYSKRVEKIVMQYPNHIVYAQGLSAWAGINKFKNRIVTNPHGLEPFQSITLKEKFISIPFKIVFAYIWRRSARVISLGGKLTPIIRSHLSNKNALVEIPNATLLPVLSSEQSNDNDKNNSVINIFFLSRFASNKGIDILMRAIEELNIEGIGKNFNFILGGKGPLWNFYKEKNTHVNISFPGFIDDEALPGIFKSCDVFLLPTLFEGMPTVILEAMSYKKPIIATRVGAIEVIVDETNGILINANSTTELKQAIRTFQDLSSAQRLNLGISSRKKVENFFNWKSVTKDYINLFSSIHLN